MRNKHEGVCYRCGETVAVGDGHFERFAGGWRTQHASCCQLAKAWKIAGFTPTRQDYLDYRKEVSNV